MKIADRKPNKDSAFYLVYTGSEWSQEDVSTFVKRRGGTDVSKHEIVSGVTGSSLFTNAEYALTFKDRSGYEHVALPGYVIVLNVSLDRLSAMPYHEFQSLWQVRDA